MGRLKHRTTPVAVAAAMVSAMTTTYALNTANNTTDFTKKIVSKERVGYKTPSDKNGGPLIGIPASAPAGRPSMGSDGSSPSGRRYWFRPDAVKILKVRGDSGETTTLRENDQGQKTGRKVLPLLPWSNPKSPELAGWGPVHPYEDVGYAKESNYMYSVLGETISNRSGVVTRPFDAGLTRYEMWVKKAARPESGWKDDAWFFNSYNVVSQGGGVLGQIDITTPDSLLGSNRNGSATRTFRDAPYLLDVTENSGVMRAYAPSIRQDASVLTNSVSLVSQPKMLVLLSPDSSHLAKSDFEVREGSASINRVTRESQLAPRSYTIPPAPGSPLPPDIGRQLSPNKNINDAGPNKETTGEGTLSQNYKTTPLAKNWHYDNSKKTWHFRQWQRGEFLPENQPHTWILETKEDLLYAPQTTSQAVVDPNRITILDPQTTPVTDIPSTIVASGRVNAFDTGGFRLAVNDAMKKSQWGTSGRVFDGIEGIPDFAAMNLAPVGYFYPDSRIIVALEYVLLKKVGGSLVEDGGWKTGKIHYWNSAEQPGDAFTAKEVTFNTNPSNFDPYSDGWIFPIKDVSHTSAKYRLRVFMALPFTSVSRSGGPLPSSFEENIASTFRGDNFGINEMVKLLDVNSKNPVRLAENDPMSFNGAYREALSRIGLSGVYGEPQTSVRVVSPDEVERVVSGVTFAGAGKSLSVSDIGDIRAPFGNPGTTWFEFVMPEADWTVDVPEITVGLDPEEAGVIITE